MSKKRWKLWAIPGLLGLLIVALLSKCSPIENDLQQRSQSLLTEQGLDWASTELEGRGRDLLITGTAPSEAAKDKAIKLAQEVYGVRTVNHDIIVKEYVSSVLKLKRAEDKVILEGSLPDQPTIDQIITKAQSLFGEGNVVNELTVNGMTQSPEWLAGATGLIEALYGADGLAMEASDSQISITGTVATQDAKTQLLQQAQSSFGDQFSESIGVVKLPPSAAELAAIEAARLAEEQRLAAEAEAARIAEEQRLAAEVESARTAEEQRLAAEATAIQLAEERRITAEALLAAEKKRLAAEAKVVRILEEQRLAAIAEAARIAEEKRLAAEAEAARIAEEKRLTEEAEAARIAEEKRLAEEAEAALIAKEKRLAEEAEAARAAEEKRLAEAVEAARIAEEKRLIAKAAKAKYLAEQNRQMLTHCQFRLNELINTHPPVFSQDSNVIIGSSYNLLSTITLHVNSCSKILHHNHLSIDVISQAGDGETPLSPELSLSRAQAIVSYLENINGIHPGLLRPRKNNGQQSIGQPQLHFTITE